MSLQSLLKKKVIEGVSILFDAKINEIEFQTTRKEFEGDITIVIFPMLRILKGNPVIIGEKIGNYLVENEGLVKSYNVVKGFLNVVIKDKFYIDFLNSIKDDSNYGYVNEKSDTAVMVEYSSPNTNKPLHLGHVRNVLLGYSVSEILKASGRQVYKTQIINDRGIHICKSMLAWEKFGEGETPESSGLKGDKLVGKYYVKFEEELRKQAQPIYEKLRDNDFENELNVTNNQVTAINNFIKNSNDDEKIKEQKSKLLEIARNRTEILKEAQQMLQKWELGDESLISLWKKMNSWVYEGFEKTYKNIGVDFDKNYYESDTYLLGKEFIKEGLKTGVFYKKEDGSVWCDFTEEGLDEKIVLRSDGTAVYMTQDIGTAIQRIKDFPNVSGMVYTVGNEQDYHFKVLFLILKKLGFDWATNLYHLSYGMVDLPSGKMKSREGTVVDADDLIDQMSQIAEEISKELGKLEGYNEDEKKSLYKTIGLGALKYFILKVDPKKRILFNPKESIDFQGNTGPFIQYTYARIKSILRKSNLIYLQENNFDNLILHEKEKQLLKQLELFPNVIKQAAEQFSPALVANYTYDLVKDFNSFYQNVSILGAETDLEKSFRVILSKTVGDVIKNAFSLLGIKVPNRM